MFTSNGEYSFKFMFNDEDFGEYNVFVGGDNLKSVVHTTFDYKPMFKRMIADVDLNIKLDGYVPVISGTINTYIERSILLEVYNLTDEISVFKQAIKGESEAKNVSFLLPSLVNNKEYEIRVKCIGTNTDEILSEMNVNIDSSMALISASGNASTSENILVDAAVNSTQSDILNKQTSFSGNKEFDFTIPNLISSAQFILDATVYETSHVDFSSEFQTQYIKQIDQVGEYFNVAINVRELDKLNEKIFTLTYPSDLVEISAANMEILGYTEGKIVFKLHETFPVDKLVSKTVNIIEFKTVGVGTAEINCVTERGEE